MIVNDISDKIQYQIQNLNVFKNKRVEECSLNLLYQIQPAHGILIKDSYIRLGDGYMTCIHIYDASEDVSRNWMFDLFNFRDTVTTVDIDTMDEQSVKNNLNRALNEYEDRYEEAKSNSDKKESLKTYSELDRLLDEVTYLKNSIKSLHIRIFVYGRSFEELENNVISVQQRLKEKTFSKFGININEQGAEYKSLFLPISTQNKTLSSRKGIPCPSKALAYGLPFHHVSWIDENGFHLGDTSEDAGSGVVIFDQFKLDRYRLCYDGFIAGRKGTGKSTTLKRLIEENLATGNKVRIIDVTGEFIKITKHYGGIVIKMDGSEGRLNPLEILRMEEDDAQNYMKHISKMSLMYQLKKPDCDSGELNLFKNLLNKLYKESGLIIEENGRDIYKGITGRSSMEYPIYSDLLNLIDRDIQKYDSIVDKESSKIRIKNLVNIHDTIEDIVINYGEIFNGHSNISKLMDADIITFDLNKIADMESTIYDMQLFNVLSIAYDSCMDLGIKMKNMYDNREIALEDVVHHIIYIDECHKSINSRKPFAIERMLDILRQDRKYFIGVWFATQNVSDMCPTDESEVSTNLKTLFNLCQYKMIFQQEDSSIPYIKNAFGSCLTESEIGAIPALMKQECFLSLSTNSTIRLRCNNIPEYKLKYYGGGA